MQDMKKVAALILMLLAFAHLTTGDSFDNQIDSSSSRQQRPLRVRSYMLRRCNKCGPNECQVLGMQRYSEPRCEPFGGLGSPCRMWQEPENKTLHYPDSIMKCNDVYMQFCPCASGLVCEQAECKRSTSTEALYASNKELRFDFKDDDDELRRSLMVGSVAPNAFGRADDEPEYLDRRMMFGGGSKRALGDG